MACGPSPGTRSSGANGVRARQTGGMRSDWRVLSLLVLILAGCALAWTRPGAQPVPADALAGAFSAARAARAAAPVLAEPRPTGTPANDRSREELVRRLTADGWQVHVQSRTAFVPPPRDGQFPAVHAFVHNVVATRPGTDPTGTVVLATHYDSVPGTQGAADDGLGVAVLLEAGRVLAEEGPSRNDVMLLFTDGEENGLLGARAFQAAGEPLREPVFVVNHEARGNAGVPLVVRTAGDVRAMLRAGPRAEAESYSDAMFDLAPVGSDFSVWRDELGWSGVELALVGNGSAYHSPLDSPQNLDPASLQQTGELTTAMATTMAQADLPEHAGPAAGALTSTPWGSVTVPGALVPLLGGAGLLLTVVSLVRHRRAGRVGVRAVLAGVGVLFGLGLLSLAVAAAAWPVARALDPAAASTGISAGEPAVGWPYVAAELVAVAAGLVTLLLLTRRRPGWPAVAHAGVLLVSLPTLLVGLALPELVVVTAVPSLAAGAGLLLAAGPGRWRLAAGTLAVLPGAWLWGGQLPGLFDQGTAFSMGFTAFVTLLGVWCVLPVLAWNPEPERPAVPRRRWWAIAACWVLVAVPVATGLYLNRVTGQPRQERLSYEVTDGTGRWTGTERSAWARSLPDGPAPLPPPTVQVVHDEVTRDRRVLTLQVTPARGGTSLRVAVDGDLRADHWWSVQGDGSLRAEGAVVTAPGVSEAVFVGPPANGIRLELTLPAGGHRRVTVSETTHDLTAAPGWQPPPDGWVVSQPRVIVSAEHRL